MTQRNSFENINKLATAFKNTANVDVIFDHDGTMMDSSTAEAKRIVAVLCETHPNLLDFFSLELNAFVTDIKNLGYGKNGIWASQLLTKLKLKFPSLANFIQTNEEILKTRIDPDAVNELIIQKSVDLEEISGTADFVRRVIDQGNQVAVFSGNWAEVVYVALNKHLAKVNVSCPSPRDQELNRHATQLVQNLIPQTIAPYPSASISAFNDSHGQKLRRKPEADGLLMQKFSLLLQRGLVTKEDAKKFLTDGLYRSSLSKLTNYRQSIYIGDDFIDLQAAIRAGFEHFIAVNDKESEANKKMVDLIKTSPEGTINILYVDNLAQAAALLFNTSILNEVKSSDVEAIPETLGFFSTNSKNHQNSPSIITQAKTFK